MIIKYLDDAADNLRDELRKIDRNIVVTHDNKLVLEVYAEAHIKAYVPKKYNGFDVQFTVWDKQDIIDLDQELTG